MDTPKKKAVTKRQRAGAVVILAVTTLVVFLLTAVAITPSRYNIEAGDVAPATITASREVVDSISTDEEVAKARAAVTPVYRLDDSVTAGTEQSVSGYFDSLNNIASYLETAYITAQVAAGGKQEELQKNYDPSKVDWNGILTSDTKAYIKSAVGDNTMTDPVILALAEMNKGAVNSMKGNVLSSTAIALDGGIIEERLQAEKDSIKREITNMYTDQNIQHIALLPVDRYLKANMLYDAAATNTAMDAAAEKVEPKKYKLNQTIVTAGEVVTAAQLAVLKELGLVGAVQDKTLYIGMFLFIAAIFLIYAFYLFRFEIETIAETRKLVMICSAIAVVTILAVPLTRLDTRIITAFFGSMIICVLVSQRSAMALSVLLAFIAGAVCSWNSGLLSLTTLRTILITSVGGSAAVLSLYKTGYRSTLIYSGFIAGIAGAVMAVTVDMMGNSWASADIVLTDCAYAMGSGVLGGVLAIGTQPLWEAAFRVSTPARLVELSDPSNPILKRLVVEAPGTYYHSVMAANLAEAGAEAVDANALLCRVGAYYHDIGKLREPEYFKENQKDINPHDTLDPRASAKIITGHLTYGMELAKKYKLPKDVQKIIAQHHGDMTVPFFFHKAQEAGISTDDPVFRYKGSKPSSRESAVVMLSDCVEAAVKSIDNPDIDQIRDMINRIIRARYNEGQLDECTLGRKEMNALSKAFVGVYEGSFHERIKYPEQEVTDA